MSNRIDWSALSMKDRAEFIKIAIDKGIINRKSIIELYNKFEDGGNTEDTVYYDNTPIETPVVKAFNSEEDYNRYYGKQFGKKVAEGMNNAAPYVLEAAMLPFTISGAVETPMLLYQGVKAAPQLVKGAKTLLTKGKKAFGKKVLGMVEDMNDYIKEGSHFRIVDKPALDDAIESGLIRAKTGLHHDAVTYLNNNFSDYLKDIPGWDRMDANDLRGILESKGAFNSGGDALRREAMLQIRNSTNHGGSVHYFKGMPYPNYEINPTNYIIETPENIGSFVAGHGGKEFVDIPLEHAGATLLKTNGSVKGASIPSKGSSYWEYSPFFEMWKNKKFATGGPIGEGQKTYNHPKYNHKEEAEMYSYLRSKGVPHVQASAIMGNIAVESMLNPEITQIGGGGGYGLIQATDRSRKNAFINYDGQPYEFGSNISPETQRQLDYIVDKGLNTQTRGEWRGNHNIGRASVARRKFLEATDVNKASKIFTENYLRPGKPHTKRRKSMSNYFYDNYAKTERALDEFSKNFIFSNK